MPAALVHPSLEAQYSITGSPGEKITFTLLLWEWTALTAVLLCIAVHFSRCLGMLASIGRSTVPIGVGVTQDFGIYWGTWNIPAYMSSRALHLNMTLMAGPNIILYLSC